MRERDDLLSNGIAEPDETDTSFPIDREAPDEEPFAGRETLSIPASTLNPDEARLKSAVERAALSATRKSCPPDGNPDAAEALSDWAIDQFRVGAQISAIKDCVGKACRKLADGSMDWGRASSYANTCLQSWRSAPDSSRGDAWKPEAQKLRTYQASAEELAAVAAASGKNRRVKS